MGSPEIRSGTFTGEEMSIWALIQSLISLVPTLIQIFKALFGKSPLVHQGAVKAVQDHVTLKEELP